MSCIPPNAKIQTAETILEEAERVVNGPRRRDYDHPYYNFQRIADLWSVLFDIEISSRAVAQAIILMKVARDMHSPKRDNLVDICGYARCIELVEEYVEPDEEEPPHPADDGFWSPPYLPESWSPDGEGR